MTTWLMDRVFTLRSDAELITVLLRLAWPLLMPAAAYMIVGEVAVRRRNRRPARRPVRRHR